MRSAPRLPVSLRAALAAALCAVLVSHAQAPVSPGPEHEALKKLAGEWTATVKSPEGEVPGTMTARMEMGGLWLSSEFRSTFMGQPFVGRGLDTYDPATRKHVSVWVDSMITRPLVFEGTMDPTRKTLTMTAEGTGMDGKPARFKSVSHYPDADHQHFTLYQVGADGSEQKMISIEYVRKKS